MEKAKNSGQNKNKLLLVAGLSIVIVGVGVFQFTQGSSSAPKHKAEPSQSQQPSAANPTTDEPSNVPLGGLVASQAPKDPFKPIPLPKEDVQNTGTSTIVKAPPMQTPPKVGYGGPPLPPGNGATLAPMNPTNGTVTPGTKAVAPDEFTFTLVGIVSGPRPVAVFEDSAGSQKLVRQGEAFDEGSRVVSITDDHVTVRHGKKTLTLTVGGRK